MSLRELSFVSQEPITSLTFIRYHIKLIQTVEPSEQARAIGILARDLEYRLKSPILADSSNSSILSSIPLSSNDKYKILREDPINLADEIHERFLFEICTSALVNAFNKFPSPPRIDRYKKRIYSNDSFSLERTKEAKLTDDNPDKIEGQKYLTFDFVRNHDQKLVLILDFASEYHSRATINEIGLDNLEIGQKLVHTYDGKVCEYMGVAEETISTQISGLANNSLIEFHQQRKNISEQDLSRFSKEAKAIRVNYPSIRGKSFEALHIAELLRKVYDRGHIDDDIYHANLWKISEKVDRATQTVKILNQTNRFCLLDQVITFSTDLRNFETSICKNFPSGTKVQNLDFGKHPNSEQRLSVSYPSAGLDKYYLLDKPTQSVKSVLLYPPEWEKKAKGYRDALKNELHKFGINLLVSSQAYNPKDKVEIRQVCQSIKECDFVFACVPNESEFSQDPSADPYKIIKKQLVQRKIPSQMIMKSNLDKGWDKYKGQNLIIGINAKLGYASWCIKETTGTAQSFIGLDVSRKDGKTVGASAFVLDAHGQLIDWAASDFQAFQESFDPEILENLLLDFFSAYPTKHLVIHRDGKLQDAEFKVLTKIKNELSSKGLEKLDVVEVIKSGFCRAVWVQNVDGVNIHTNPKRGWGWLHSHNEAVILTTGAYEAKVSPNSSPRPLRIKRRMGDTDLLTLAEQVYWLSEMQVGSTQTIRLPITTYYADRAAEFAQEGLLPRGIQRDKRLWFL